MVHRMIGGVVVLAWLWMVCHLGHWAPSLGVAASSGIGRAGRGAILLIFPGFFASRFSPSSGLTSEPLLGVGFWRFFGYFALLVSWGLLQLFR
jgi:hypothetical protein